VPFQFGCKGTTNILNKQRFFYEFIELNEFFFSLPLMPFMPVQILIQAAWHAGQWTKERAARMCREEDKERGELSFRIRPVSES